jgi:hypothetical protein
MESISHPCDGEVTARETARVDYIHGVIYCNVMEHLVDAGRRAGDGCCGGATNAVQHLIILSLQEGITEKTVKHTHTDTHVAARSQTRKGTTQPQ